MAKLVTGSVTVSQMPAASGVPDPTPQNMNAVAFTALIQKNGLAVTWEKALFCPFRTNEPTPNTHDINCKTCNGDGYIYVQPVETKMLVSGATIEQVFYIQGRFDGGIAQISAMPGDLIGYWDRVTVNQSTIRYTQPVERLAKTTTDPLRYTALDVLHVQYQDRVFTKDRDFRVKDNQIVWTSNKSARPPDGEFYTTLYTRRPVYIILNLQHQHREVPDTIAGTTQQMPLQATAKLDFLVRDETRDNSTNKPVSPFPPRVENPVSGIKD